MVTRVYDRIAARYDEDWAGIYASARRCCLEQIGRAAQDFAQPLDTVDLGIGTGNSLHELRARVQLGQCTGFDVSPGMLQQAAGKLGDHVALVRDDALAASKRLQTASTDLVLCHFLLSFVAAEPLLDEAYRLLRPGGLISLATSTQRSLSELHSGRFYRSGQILGVRRALRRSSTPADHRHCLGLLRERGFEPIESCLQRRRLQFRSFADVRNWALNSGWAAAALDDPFGLRIACCTAAFAVARLVMHPLYPIDANSEISIVLAKKPAPPPTPAGDIRGAELSV